MVIIAAMPKQINTKCMNSGLNVDAAGLGINTTWKPVRLELEWETNIDTLLKCDLT